MGQYNSLKSGSPIESETVNSGLFCCPMQSWALDSTFPTHLLNIKNISHVTLIPKVKFTELCPEVLNLCYNKLCDLPKHFSKRPFKNISICSQPKWNCTHVASIFISMEWAFGGYA